MTGPPDLSPIKKGAPDSSPESAPLNTSEPTEKSVADRIVRYEFLKSQQTEIIEHLLDVGEIKLAEKMLECGTFLRFHEYMRLGKTALVGANFCKQHIYCPLCAGRRASSAVTTYSQRLQYLFDEHQPLYAHLITHTVKNGDNLAERFMHLSRSLSKLFNRRQSPLRYPRSTFVASIAGITAIEIKLGKNSDSWHPHAHTLVLSRRQTFDWHHCKMEWLEITGDSRVVNFTACDPSISLAIHAREVLKYCAKFGDLSPAQRHEVGTTLRRRPLYRPWGELRGLTLPESLCDSSLAGEPYIETLWRWLGTCYTLQRHRVADS